MIKLSTKGRYGSRLMLNLAKHFEGGGRVTILKNIARDEDISIRYLEQITIPLKISRLIKSVRGSSGGYVLAKPPSQITLCEILDSLEGSCCLVPCIEDKSYCKRISFCTTHLIWKEATELLRNFFMNITLADLLEIARQKSQEDRVCSKTERGQRKESRRTESGHPKRPKRA